MVSEEYDNSDVLINDFKTLYNNQYLLNVEIFAGILILGGFITKMLFYETIDLTTLTKTKV